MTQTDYLALLKTFGEAWNNHDIETLMSCMHAQGVFQTVAGPDACGTRHATPEAVRKAFESAWLTIPDAAWENPKCWVLGDQGVMESTFTGTAADGSRIEADMVDLLVFKDGKIILKNAFRKQRPNLPAKA